MSGGHYPSVGQTRSSQEFVAPRHRLPVMAPPRTLSHFSSTSSISHAHSSHPLWIKKHNFSSNYHDDSGYYGHTVPRDYSSISRAHCNEESSTWSNPHFSNPLGNPPFGGVTANENMNVKDDIQQESMDLSAGHHSTPVITPIPCGKLLVNGDTSRHSLKGPTSMGPTISESSKILRITSDMRDSAANVIATNPSATEELVTRDLNSLSHKVVSIKKEQIILPSENVEFALESMFQSDNRSPGSSSSSVIVSSLSEISKDLCTESVEKILKSPSPEKDYDNDNLAILDDSNNERVTDVEDNSVKKSLNENTACNIIKNYNSKAVNVKNKICDNFTKSDHSEFVEILSLKSSSVMIQDEKSHEVKPIEKVIKNCDLKKRTDQISLERAPSNLVVDNSSRKEDKIEKNNFIKNSESDNVLMKSTDLDKDSTSPIKPSNNDLRSEEITYVEVENELEKMFAGIEDTAVNGLDENSLAMSQQNATSAGVDAHKNLASLCTTENLQSSTSLFGSVSIPTKTSKKKALKKSKCINSSTKSTRDGKQKLWSSVKESSLLDNTAMKRVPVIHIEGSKEKPISACIINSIKLEEDDINDSRTSAKRKLGKSDRAVKKSANNYAIKNYDPGTSNALWSCIFCNLSAHTPGMAGEPTGDLFGPYFIRTLDQINLDDEAKRFSRKGIHVEQVKKKQKRSLSVESGYMDSSSSEEQKSLEIWAHENCIVWAPGVHLIGSKLIGLEEAVMQALDTLCAHCSNKGASIGCRARHCNSCAHYSCALYTGWKLDPETFISTCSVHSVRD